jgi:hypothetical protein
VFVVIVVSVAIEALIGVADVDDGRLAIDGMRLGLRTRTDVRRGRIGNRNCIVKKASQSPGF